MLKRERRKKIVMVKLRKLQNLYLHMYIFSLADISTYWMIFGIRKVHKKISCIAAHTVSNIRSDRRIGIKRK